MVPFRPHYVPQDRGDDGFNVSRRQLMLETEPKGHCRSRNKDLDGRAVKERENKE